MAPERLARGIHGRVIPGTFAIAALVGVCYVPAMFSGFIWDDDQYVYANPTLNSLEGLGRIWTEPGSVPQYYPLVFTTFWMERHLWGLQPAGYHVLNVMLHIGNAVLLWRILAALRLPGAWAAAAIFAIHPVQVESVAWVTECKNVLSGFFYFASAMTYLRLAELGRKDALASNGGRWRYLASMALFVCALASKTVTATLPAALLLMIWWQHGRVRTKDILLLAPFFILGICAAAVTAVVEKEHVGAAGPEFGFSTMDRGLIAGRAVWFYAGKLLWPHTLTFIYPRWSIDPHAAWQYGFPFAAIMLVIGLWWAKGRMGRGPLAACLFFGGTLIPALGFINVFPMRFSFVADHFQYLASVGLICLFTAWAALAIRRFIAADRQRSLGTGLAAAILGSLGVLTWRQCRIYEDEETLWHDTLAENPSAWIALDNLGIIAASRGETDEAIRLLTEATDINPHFVEGQTSLGGLLLQKGRLAEARFHLIEAIHSNPNLSGAHGNLGVAALHEGKTDEAIGHFRRALQLDPQNFTARYNLGCALLSLGQTGEAIAQLRAAQALSPGDSEVAENLRKALQQEGAADARR